MRTVADFAEIRRLHRNKMSIRAIALQLGVDGTGPGRLGRRVRFVTAANLVTQLEEAQQQHRLERVLSQLDRVELLVIDDLGYLSFSRANITRVDFVTSSAAPRLNRFSAERIVRSRLEPVQPRMGSPQKRALFKTIQRLR